METIWFYIKFVIVIELPQYYFVQINKLFLHQLTQQLEFGM